MYTPNGKTPLLALNSKEVADSLININCVQFSVQNPFTWVSGIKSPIYCDNRKINSYVDIRRIVLDAFIELILDKFPDCEIIAGVATGGIPMGALIADKLNKPFIYVRQKPKEHGLMKQVEGSFKAGDKIVLIEDHVSTGGSSLKAIQGLRDVNLNVQAIISIMTYGFKESIQRFEDNNITHYSLCNLDVILDSAESMGIINNLEKESILRFRENPKTWFSE